MNPADEHEEVEAKEGGDMDTTMPTAEDDDDDLVQDDPKVAKV